MKWLDQLCTSKEADTEAGEAVKKNKWLKQWTGECIKEERKVE